MVTGVGEPIIEQADDLMRSPPDNIANAKAAVREAFAGVTLGGGVGLSEAQAATELSSAGRQLGTVIAPVVQALGLRDVVLSGPSELIDGPFRQATESAVLALTRPFADEQVTVRMSALGRDGVLHGAAALVLDGELGLS